MIVQFLFHVSIINLRHIHEVKALINAEKKKKF